MSYFTRSREFFEVMTACEPISGSILATLTSGARQLTVGASREIKCVGVEFEGKSLDIVLSVDCTGSGEAGKHAHEVKLQEIAAMTIHNRLTRTLGIKHPILLAPMDVVSGGRLAAAVSNAGGLGLLGGGYGDRDWIERERARAGNARIGCGFITWSLAKRPELLDGVLAHRPAAVMLSFGDPRPFGPTIRAADVRLICQVQTVAQAREVLEAGADVIVAQGTEAGGHGQTEPLITLLPRVVDLCPGTPVVAAGGIADGRGVAAAMMLGAQGVLMGTRFYASEEAEGHPDAKQRIVAAEGGDTVRSIVFDLSRRNRWPAPYTGRVLRNRHAERWLGREAELEARVEEVAHDYAEARERGDFDVAAVIVGEACALIHDILPAGEIVERVVAEAERLLPPQGDIVG